MNALSPRWPALCAVAIVVSMLPSPVAASFLGFGKKKVERIVVDAPMRNPPVAALRPVPPPGGRATCVDVRRVRAAQIFGDSAVELTLRGGRRWRMYFAQTCPALSFYDGFYYRNAEQGRLCAGRDAIIARSGGECSIASIVASKPLPRELRRRRAAGR